MKCSHKAKTTSKLFKAAAVSILLMAIMVVAATIRCVWLDHKLLVLQQQMDESEKSLGTVAAEQININEAEDQEKTKPLIETLNLKITGQHGDSEVEIPVTLVLPETDGQEIPLVLCCHGFTGNRNLDGHFSPLAEQLAVQGIACASLDFSGNGESSEPFTAYTLSNMEQDIDTVLKYLEDNYSVNPEKIGLLGHSMGGRVVALHLNDSIAAAALWSPAAASGLDGLEFLAHSESERLELYREIQETASLDIHGWNVTVSNTFVSEMAESKPWQTITNYQGNLLIAFTAADEEILSQDTIDGTLEAAHARKMNFVNLYGQFYDATHNYTGVEGADDEAVRNRIEAQTAQFFRQTLLWGTL